MRAWMISRLLRVISGGGDVGFFLFLFVFYYDFFFENLLGGVYIAGLNMGFVKVTKI